MAGMSNDYQTRRQLSDADREWRDALALDADLEKSEYHIRKRAVFEFLESHGLVGAAEADACISGVECKNCRYWQARADSRFGECRRRAPVTRREGDLAMWPAPRDDDWCGEWEGKA